MNGNFLNAQKISYLLGFSMIILLCQCSDSKEQELKEKTALITRLQQEREDEDLIRASYMNELDAINNALDTARVLQFFFQDKEGLIIRKEALEKVQTALALIDSMDQKASDIQTPNRDFFIQKSFEAAQKELKQLRGFYEELNVLIEKVELENVNIKNLLKDKNREIQQKSTIISGLREEVSAALIDKKIVQKEASNLEKQKITLITELKKIENELTNEKRVLAMMYFERGENLIHQFEKVLIKGEKAKIALKNAVEALNKAHALGNQKAKKLLNQIKKKKKYKKYLK